MKDLLKRTEKEIKHQRQYGEPGKFALEIGMDLEGVSEYSGYNISTLRKIYRRKKKDVLKPLCAARLQSKRRGVMYGHRRQSKAEKSIERTHTRVPRKLQGFHGRAPHDEGRVRGFLWAEL